MKPRAVFLAALSIALLAFPDLSLARTGGFAGGHGFANAHGFVGGNAGGHGFVAHGAFEGGRAGRSIGARGRGAASDFAGGRARFAFGGPRIARLRGARAFERDRRFGRFERLGRADRFGRFRGRRGHTTFAGEYSGWRGPDRRFCSGPVIYEIGKPRPSRSRLPRLIYGSAPACLGAVYAVGPGVYSLN